MVKNAYDSLSDEDAPYLLETDTRPKIVNGYLPNSGSLKGKPITHPVQTFTTNKPSKGAPKEERVPEQRGVDKELTTPSPG